MFKCFPSLFVLIMSNVSVMVPYVCPAFNMWLDDPRLLIIISDCLYMFFASGMQYLACLCEF
jgi:hypothetical protein